VTSGSLSPGTDVDQIDLRQGFVDLKTPIGQEASLTFRGGRQEMEFGAGRLIDVREARISGRVGTAAAPFINHPISDSTLS
jgi:hypothetical protein